MDILNIIFGLIGIIGLVYAIWSDHKRTSIESYVEGNIKAIRESIVEIQVNATNAKSHFDKMAEPVLDISDPAKRLDAVKRIKYGRSDVKAIEALNNTVERQLNVLLARNNKSARN